MPKHASYCILLISITSVGLCYFVNLRTCWSQCFVNINVFEISVMLHFSLIVLSQLMALLVLLPVFFVTVNYFSLMLLLQLIMFSFVSVSFVAVSCFVVVWSSCVCYLPIVCFSQRACCFRRTCTFDELYYVPHFIMFICLSFPQTSVPHWEDFQAKAAKLHTQLKWVLTGWVCRYRFTFLMLSAGYGSHNIWYYQIGITVT